MGDYFVNLFARKNREHNRYFVFRLGTRGFFAEITTVARAAIYAHIHQLQLVLDNDRFGYRCKEGWADYYESFCEIYQPWMEAHTVQVCDANKPGIFMSEIVAHSPEQLTIGPCSILGFQNIFRIFMLMICRPNQRMRDNTKAAMMNLALSGEYAAIHIRRGDKVGWEDVYYPVDIYLDHLEKKDGGDLPIFVMSDDFVAVQEFERCLSERGRNNILYSLCAPENRGFDVWALRAKKLAYRHGTDDGIVDENQFLRETYQSASDLVVETLLAIRSDIFIGTFRSNVSKTIWLLHESPEKCHLLHQSHLKQTN